MLNAGIKLIPREISSDRPYDHHITCEVNFVAIFKNFLTENTFCFISFFCCATRLRVENLFLLFVRGGSSSLHFVSHALESRNNKTDIIDTTVVSFFSQKCDTKNKSNASIKAAKEKRLGRLAIDFSVEKLKSKFGNGGEFVFR